jgi:hypothetical protein
MPPHSHSPCVMQREISVRQRQRAAWAQSCSDSSMAGSLVFLPAAETSTDGNAS